MPDKETNGKVSRAKDPLYHYMYHTRSSWGNKEKIGEKQERIVRVILLNSFDLWRASESK